MSYLYLTDSSAKLGISGNYLVVKNGTEIIEKIPVETMEAISVYGKSQITTQCIQECLKRKIPITYYSYGGKYYGRLQPSGNIGVHRQRKQAVFNTNPIAIELAKKIIKAKIHNQAVILRRYATNKKINISQSYSQMHILKNKIQNADKMEIIMGFEGNAARIFLLVKVLVTWYNRIIMNEYSTYTIKKRGEIR